MNHADLCSGASVHHSLLLVMVVCGCPTSHVTYSTDSFTFHSPYLSVHRLCSVGKPASLRPFLSQVLSCARHSEKLLGELRFSPYMGHELA